MSDGQYILEGKTPVLCNDLTTWGEWMQKAERHVANDYLPDGVHVSTVFLGLDHGFHPTDGGTPILFETMIFGGEHDQYQERYATWEEAEEGHKRAVAMCFEA